MPSATLLRDHRTAIASLAQLADVDLRGGIAGAVTSDETRDALLDTIPLVVRDYSEAAASISADWYDQLRADSGAPKRFRAIPALPPDAGQTESLARWAVSPMYQADPDVGTTIQKASGGVQRLIANADRSTIARSVGKDPAGARFSRVASAGACKFCLMLAGRGAVYLSQATAGGHSYHDSCHCIAVPTWGVSKPTPPVLPSVEEVRPEPEFVDRIAALLRSGDLTVEQLRAQSAVASPLGQANADEALRLYGMQKPTVVASKRPPVAAAPPKFTPKVGDGSVAGRVAFPQDALDALLPGRGGWTTSTRDKLVKELKATPEGRQLLKTMDSFQSGGSTAIPRLRTDIEKYLSGNVGGMAQGRIDAIENFLSAVGNSDAGGRALWRGMSIPGDIDTIAARYQVGGDLDLSIASFSTDKKLAQDFTEKGAGKKVRAATKTPVLVEWVGEGKRALPIENLSKSRVFAKEKEWVGAGRYTIEGSKRVKRNGVETLVLQIRQKATW